MIDMEKKVIEIISAQVENTTEVSSVSLLREDLGLSSFSLMVIICDTEDLFNIELNLSDISQVRTVSDYISLVEQSLKLQEC